MTDAEPSPFKLLPLPGFLRLVARMETALALPNGFSRGLLDEDDWSFVVKLHALLEASITMLLVERLGGPSTLREPEKHVESLATRTKINLAYSLGLFDADARLFLNKLSELRNGLVHRVANVGVSLSDRIAAMTDRQKAEFTGWVVPGPHSARTKQALEKPRLAMWLRAFFLICMWKLDIDRLRIERGHTEGDVLEPLENLRQVGDDLAEIAKLMKAEGLDPEAGV